MPVFDYIVNYDYIRTELCINKEIPIMGCDGKCYLMKQLAAASETEKPISTDKKHAATETTDLFIAELNAYDAILFENSDNTSVNQHYSNLYSNLDVVSFFHPPAVIS